MDYTCTLCKYTTRSEFQRDLHNLSSKHELAALRAERDELREALTRILSNPLFQDEIANNPRTNYLDRDARAILAKYDWTVDDILKQEG